MKTNLFFLVLFSVALYASGCSTAVANAEDDDVTTADVDATSGGTNVQTSTDVASTQQGVDSNAQSTDVASSDTTKSVDVAQQVDSGIHTNDVHHSANTNDAGVDVKSAIDTGSSKDVAQNNVDAKQDASNPFKCQSNEECNAGLSCQKYVCLFGVITNGVKGSICSPATFQEVCDGIDNNCNGLTDEDEKWMQTYYEDKDGDGFGNPNAPKKACSKPIGYVVGNTDCDDTSTLVRPGMLELCDGKDNDCNGVIDDGVKLITYYVDKDNDGYGWDKDPLFPSTTLCSNDQSIPSYYVANKSDCNDKNATVHPGALENCIDSIDNNCDGVVNEGCFKCEVNECALLGGKCDPSGLCKTFCDTCMNGQNCLDTNQDGLADKCENSPKDTEDNYPENFTNGSLVIRLTKMKFNMAFSTMGHIQTYYAQNQIGTKWDDELSIWWSAFPYSTTGGFYFFKENGPKAFLDETACGMRVNVTIDENAWDNIPASTWLCMGSGSSAHLLDGAQLFHLHNGVFIDITKLAKVWPQPNGQGCSILIETQKNCPLQ